MGVLLKINDLWGGYTEGVNILRGISMEVQQGETLGVIGLNGSGKSTFGKAIMNMIPIRKGDFFYEGENITTLMTHQLYLRGISIMQQGGRVFANLSVWDNLLLAYNNSRLSADKFSPLDGTLGAQLQELIPLLQRPKKELQHLLADKLSGGQKHQLALAMTLISSPSLVILDEPSAGLSPISVEGMYSILHAVRKEHRITLILIEQNIAKALDFCNRCVMLRQGISHDIHIKNLKEIENILFN